MIIRKNTTSLGKDIFANVEMFNSGQEMWEASQHREITDQRFVTNEDLGPRMDAKIKGDPNFYGGIKSLEEALTYLREGYAPAVSAIEGGKPITINGSQKRFQQTQDVVGFAPIVPLVLQGVPNCMINTRMTRIKSKVLNVVYDIGAVGSVSGREILDAGKKVLRTLLTLELKGYRFTLWVAKSQYKNDGQVDMVIIKIKNASSPLDLKRMAFPISHPGFFRVCCWDWYSRMPQAKYRMGLGRSISYEFNRKKQKEFYEDILKEPCVALALSDVLEVRSDEQLNDLITKEA